MKNNLFQWKIKWFCLQMVYDKSKTSSKETSIKNKYVMGKCCFKIYFVLIIRL